MSRIGKQPIQVTKGLNVKIQGSRISVKGPKGELTWEFPPEMKVSVQDERLLVERPSDTKRLKALHGLTRNILANMVKGVNEGYQKVLEITGVGYRSQIQGKKLIMSLGYSHPVEYFLPEGITAEIDAKKNRITLNGIDRQLVGQVAANIRQLRPPDPYKGKGIRYDREMVKLKAGKAGKK
jgi:large subunit ribosomal protein L6